MKAWGEFYPHVLPFVIGCPNPTVDHALRTAAREFCLDTKAWQETEEFTADGTTNRFEFEVSGQTELVQVMRASAAGNDLDIHGRSLLPADWQTIPVCHDGLYHLNEVEYLLFPRPLPGQAISITLALRPSSRGQGVGDDVFEKHVEAIAAGAAYRLLRMPRQPWTDLEQASISKALFDKGVSDATNRDFMHTAPATRRVKSWG